MKSFAHLFQVEIESLRKVKEELTESQRSAKAALDSLQTESGRLDSTLEELKRHKTALEQQARKDEERDEVRQKEEDEGRGMPFVLVRRTLWQASS